VNSSFPDSTFIEDTALVLDEIAVLANMGIASRRGEVDGIRPELAKYRQVVHIDPLATFEGGDALRMDNKVFVGLTPRTNSCAVNSLTQILTPFGYEIIPVEVRGCLHLKTGCTALDQRTLLVNPNWIDLAPFTDFRVVPVPEDEPGAANCLGLNDIVIVPDGFPQTVKCLSNRDYSVTVIDISELMKAEAGVTCSSIIFNHEPRTME
jgi:dimethylargininase